jgi:hypothetical protein
MKRPVIIIVLGTSFLSQTVSAATLAIDSMNITGGSVTVDGPIGTSAFSYIGSNTNLVGGYIGSGGASLPASAIDPNAIVSFDWFGYPVSVYTAATNLGDTHSPAGTVAGGPVPNGTLDTLAGSITMDLRSWFGTWADGDYISGTGRSDGVTSALATGAWNPTSFAYTLTWDSLTLGPECPVGCVAHWTVLGTATPVPVPAALWLFGSGFLGLTGVSFQRGFKRA